ncbi:MAG TPA: hypothetical protein PKD99_15390 [Sphingopyxis sp.]|nr:hypothetical protein [Sphingopyxis sp.]HMP46481.1 hypothetical protein [Sphingopyxis sp.]HMQ20652.1 hypothetical protein [Sphingopyxis sp.]
MEDLVALAFIALVLPVAYFIADLAGLCVGLGWRHYSKKRKARRMLEDVKND